jgi:hypothetical protein
MILTHNTVWLLDDPVLEQQIWDNVARLYGTSPIEELRHNDWLAPLLAREQAGTELNPVERAQTMRYPEAGEDLYLQWQRFLSSCECESDEVPQPECSLHALIAECALLAGFCTELLTSQLGGSRIGHSARQPAEAE